MWRVFNRDGAEKKAPVTVVNPMVRVSASTAQSIPNNAVTAVTWDEETYKTDAGMHSVSSQTSRLVCTVAGKYRISALIMFVANATGTRDAYIAVNGVAPGSSRAIGNYEAKMASTPGGAVTTLNVDAELNLNVGDYVEIFAFQNSGGSLNLGNSYNYASMTKIDGAVVSYVGVPGSLIGQELAYAEVTADVSSSATTEATAAVVVTAPSITLDGSTPIIIEAYTPYILNNTAGNITYLVLFDNGVAIGIIGASHSATGGYRIGPVSGRRRLTPSAGAHVYSVRLMVGGGTGTVSAQAGGPGNFSPASIRITRAA